MAKVISDLSVRIGANTVGLSQGIKKARGELNLFSQVGKMIGPQLAGAFAVGSLVAFGSKAVKAYNDSIQAEKGLLNALNGREDIVERLKNQAADLQARTTVEDDAIVAQQKYAASLGLSESQIKKVIEASVQLSAATGQDLETTVKQLTQTYGGQSRGLSKMIPQIKEMTAEQLKNGDAVDYVLKNFKGYAEVAARVGTGPLVQLKNNFGNLTEEVGKRLMPTIGAFAGILNNLALSIMPKQSDELRKQQYELNGLVQAATDARISTEGRTAALQQINALYPSFLQGMNLETVTNQELSNRLKDVNAEYDKKIAYMVKEELLQDSMRKIASLRYKEVKVVQDLTRIEKNLADLKKDNNGKFTTYADLQAKQQLELWREQKNVQLDEIRQEVVNEQKAIQEALAAYSTIYGNQIPEEINKTTKAITENANVQKQLSHAISYIPNPLTGKASTGVTQPGVSAEQLPDYLKQGFLSESQLNDYKSRMKEMADYTNMINQMVRDSFVEMTVSVGEAFGNMLAGNSGIENIFKAVADSIGSFAIKMGTVLIAQGLALEAFKKSLESLNGAVAVFAGVTLVATGAAFKAFAAKGIDTPKLAQGGLAYGPTYAMVGDNRNARTDPEVIAPLSKLRGYLNSEGSLKVEFVGKIKGRDIEFQQTKETRRRRLTG